jgi:hypothetical protein
MMKLDERVAVVHLSDEDRGMLQQVGVDGPTTPGVSFDVKESDEQGVWVRLEYQDGPYMFLLRGNYILAMDMPLGAIVTEGTVN